MEKKKPFIKKSMLKWVIGAIILFIGFATRMNLEDVYKDKVKGEGKVTTYDESDGRVGRADELAYAENVSEDNKILQAYLAEYPEAKVMLACEEDLTDDGLKDLLVIHREPDDFSYATVAIDSGDGANYTFTEPTLGPYENHKIQFNNIDKEKEIEFVLMGERNGVTGYGIFRVMDGEIVNLFGEGMEDC